MTVHEKINELRLAGITNIKLGAASGFVYCGDPIPAVIGMRSGRAKLDAQREYIQRTEFLAKFETARKKIVLDKITDRFKKWMAAPEHAGQIPDIEIVGKWLNQIKASVDGRKESTKNRIATLDRRLSNWKGYLEREVLECYAAVQEPNTAIIIMEGDEQGRYWSTDEYKTGKVPPEEEGEEEDPDQPEPLREITEEERLEIINDCIRRI